MRQTFLVLLLAAAPAWAQIYKWVDEKGRVQYGEKPPASAKAAPLRGEAAPATGEPRAPVDLSRQEEAFKERRIREKLQEDREAQEAKVNQGRCENARAQLENTERFQLYRREGGEKVYYSDAEKAKELERLRGLVARYCR
jgi:hypothetical protein